MFRCLCWILVFSPFLCRAQGQVNLINSGEVWKEARTLIDSGKRAEAIALYLSVPAQDTNYVMIQKELALEYAINEEYDKSLAVSEKALLQASEFRADFLRARAFATFRKGDYEGSLKHYEAAIREFPTDVDIRYSLAMAHYNQRNYEKATQEFFTLLNLNPFISGCHLHLGIMAIRQGRKVHGMFAMGLYVSLSPSDNGRLSLLNNFVNSGVTDEGTDTPIGPNASDKLDQIIKAKIALEDQFPSVIPTKAPVIQQYELLFNQLGMIDPSTDNPWVKFYLPVYRAFQQKNMTEAFIYHLLTSSPIEAAKKWRSKNDDQLKAFFEVANSELKKHRVKVKMPDLPGPVTAWYTNNNLIEAIGEKVNNEVRTGKWIFYFENGAKRAVGEFDASGNKKGTWTYYFETGAVKSVENYDTGDVTLYEKNGAKAERLFLKNNEIHGAVETYYPEGSIKEKINFVNGKREGKYEAFFPDGTLWRVFVYKADNLDGEFRRYYPNGVLASQEFYKEGLADGPYASYYPTGKPESRGMFKADKSVGEWKYFHPNGRLSRTGRFSEEGVGIGEWVYFDLDGVLNERRRFDSDGNFQGENEVFHNAKPLYVLTYKKGMRVKVINYKEDGTVLDTHGSNDGNFAAVFYYPTGERMAEGRFSKGKKQGEWKYYSRFGNLTSHSDYRDDMVQGKLRRYHYSGALMEESEFVDDELNGYSVAFHANGKMERQGWMANDKQQQRWLFYNAEGALNQDYYYLNGSLTGVATDYAIDGKPFYSAHYNNELGVSDIHQFSQQGEVKLTALREGWKTVYEDRFGSGQVRQRFALSNGKYTGDFYRGFPDGTPLTRSIYKEDERYGPYELYFPDGTISVKVNYAAGKREGIWRQYHENGTVYAEGFYLDGERDSVWNFYYDNGKMSQTGTFRYSKLQGVVRQFAPTGLAILEKQYDNGDLTHYRLLNAEGTAGPWRRFTGNEKITASYPDGSPAWLEEFSHGVSHGRKTLYYPGGKKFSEVNFQYDNLDGPYVYYYANGNVKEQAVNRNDEREGLSEMFREDGSPVIRENFRLGVRYGKTTLYDEKGKVRKEFTFWCGMAQDQ